MANLSNILLDLEQLALRDGRAFKRLQRGLWLKVALTEDEGVLSCGIGREVPIAPSVEEEITVTQALAPAFVSDWSHRTNVPGPLDKRYNVSETTYTRIEGVG